jgi:hypothetical protein
MTHVRPAWFGFHHSPRCVPYLQSWCMENQEISPATQIAWMSILRLIGQPNSLILYHQPSSALPRRDGANDDYLCCTVGTSPHFITHVDGV